MTSANIKKVQILAELDNGEYVLTSSDNSILIRFIVELCQFIKVDENVIANMNIKDIIKKEKKDQDI
jgi:hypothetical protein